MILNGRYYSSTSQYSPYASLQIQRYKFAQANARFSQQISSAATSVFGARSNLLDGMATINANIALNRVKSQAATKRAAANGLVDKLA
jgi:hypothetical protein